MTTERAILVTGASGFLGEIIVRRLASQGLPVVGTFLTHPTRIPRADLIPLDLSDPGATERLIRDLDPRAVIHCAAMTSGEQCERDPAGAQAAILGATENIVKFSSLRIPRAPVILLSTDLVFDGTAAPYDETAPAKPLSRYGSLKVQAEAALRPLPAGVVVRAPLMYGPPGTHRGGFLEWMLPAFAEGKTVTLFEDESRTPAHAEDVADLCIAIATAANCPARLLHAGGPERLSRVEMGRIICQEFGFDPALIAIRRIAQAQTAAARPADVSLDSRRARGLFNWTPRPFARGVADVHLRLREMSAPPPPDPTGARAQP